MKKMFAVVAALLTAVAAWAGPEPAGDNLIEKQYDYRNFTGLSVSHSFGVELKQGSRYAVMVQVPGYLEPYLRVKVVNDVLVIGLDNLPKRIQLELNRENSSLKAFVTMPQLYSLQMSGATSLQSEDRFKVDNYPFKMQLSGASRVQSLSVSGKGKAYVRTSGASSAVLTCDFDEWDVEQSGSSGFRLRGGARKLDAGLSGASWAVFEDGFSEAKVETSGSAKVRLNGRVGVLSVGGSGASSVETAETQECEVDLSGAAKCKVSVQKRLKVDLSGASSCHYQAPRGLDVEIESVSRGASLKRM